ncbi:signal peptidase I [Streptacidiphilus sp. PB12-B1b]|uniref:signal peptidase I n=1 Tax=Streptacidiphilus sp. PB12-B1b TaxID=2705012 RepID=UPI0015FD28F5|nr:signal peptidase I [Streptacidiphilus sp. PB12-B1b]QMU77677.1 signal peptidase I [Streptacidiphilus sp. PB12-B1b]
MDESAADAASVGNRARGPVAASGTEVPEEPAPAAAPDGRRQRPFWKEVPLLVVAAVVMALIIKTFFVQAFYIPSQSMQNTLQPGDRVLVDKLTPWFGATPERGDVVVFKDPHGWLDDEPQPAPTSNPVLRDLQSALSTIGLLPAADDQDLIKRVIAVGGDTVQCVSGQPVRVDGVALSEPYIYPGNQPCDLDPVGTVKVPKGDLWVMGDHRDDSADSRHQRVTGNGEGFVPVGDVVGRAFVVAWPLNHWAFLSVPSTFDQHGLASSPLPAVAPAALDGAALLVPVSLWYRRRRRNRG